MLKFKNKISKISKNCVSKPISLNIKTVDKLGDGTDNGNSEML